MPQIAKTSLILSLALLALAGCGDVNKDATFDSAISRHPAGWLPDGHKAAASAKIESCTECHGSDFSGGIAKVACTQCHLGNQEEIHPLQWGQFAYALHGSFVKANRTATSDGTAACANALCHGPNLDGAGGTGPSCTSCHMGGTGSKHPVAWSSDITLHAGFVANNGTSACRNVVCHGPNLQGVFLSGPACNTCHNF
jgi:hypothetical protein